MSEDGAGVAELADAVRSQRTGREPVGVRVSPPAPWLLDSAVGRAHTRSTLRTCCAASATPQGLQALRLRPLCVSRLKPRPGTAGPKKRARRPFKTRVLAEPALFRSCLRPFGPPEASAVEHLLPHMARPSRARSAAERIEDAMREVGTLLIAFTPLDVALSDGRTH